MAAKSPRLRFFSFLVAYWTVLRKEKIVIWTSSTWIQELATLYLQAAGIRDIGALHSDLDEEQRRAIKLSFNTDPNGCMILVGSYQVGSSGLNLHHLCRYTILLESGLNRAMEAQARSRTRRLTQRRCQLVVKLYTEGSWDDRKCNLNFIFFLISFIYKNRHTGQVDECNRTLWRIGRRFQDVHVGVTEYRQGIQVQLFFMDTVRAANDKGDTGFIQDYKRLNVLCSRQQMMPVAVADRRCIEVPSATAEDRKKKKTRL